MPGPAGEILVAGAYTAAWNSVSMGLMEGDQSSPALEQINKAEPVANTNAYGKATIEAFYQGADWFYQAILEEFMAGSVGAWWPFGAVPGSMGIIARSFRAMSAALVLTAVAGTPAKDANNLNSITALYAVLAPGYNTRFLMGPTHRKLPIRQILFPYGVTAYAAAGASSGASASGGGGPSGNTLGSGYGHFTTT